MPYIGNQPQYTSFLTDTFSGNGSTTVFTMSVAPVNTAAVLVALSGVLQNPADYAVVGRILTFSSPPPTGVGNISIRYLALPASNVVSTAYRSVTEFTATAGQTTFTPASYTPGFIDVFRSGVRLGTSNYVATNGVTVTLNNPAAAGDLISIESFFVSSVLNAIPNVAGAITPTLLDSTSQSGSGALLLPSGTTAQRPASPQVGMQRWNSTAGSMEVYLNASASWVAYPTTGFSNPYNIDYMIIAGGGGGGNSFNHSACGGGGGAGGLCSAFGVPVSSGYTVMAITIGLGGAGAIGTSGSNIPGSNGQNSSIYFNNNHYPPAVAIGGGGGHGYSDDYGISGGSGGGAGGAGRFTIPGGSGAPGQGFAGGNHTGTGQSNSSTSCGGGGGAGGPGGNGTANTTGGAGGLGTNLFSTWATATGTGVQQQGYPAQSAFSRWFAGGGGGGSCLGANSAGGLGGGGIGGLGSSQNGGNAVANTGGGGGGAAAITGASANGGNGGSGIAIIRYAGSTQRGTGGTVTISGGFVYHVFTSSGTYTA
jgi:hypothetical protein